MRATIRLSRSWRADTIACARVVTARSARPAQWQHMSARTLYSSGTRVTSLELKRFDGLKIGWGGVGVICCYSSHHIVWAGSTIMVALVAYTYSRIHVCVARSAKVGHFKKLQFMCLGIQRHQAEQGLTLAMSYFTFCALLACSMLYICEIIYSIGRQHW